MTPQARFDDDGHCVRCKLDRLAIRFGDRMAAILGEERVTRGSQCGHVLMYRGRPDQQPRNLFGEDEARRDRRRMKREKSSDAD
jgi:hypothetical protein